MPWSHTVGGGKISYVIEAGHKGQKYVDKVLMPLVANRASQAFYKVDSYVWVGKDDVRVQPADLLAHEVASFQEGKISPALECFDGFVQVNRLGRRKLMEQMDIMNEMEREAKRQRAQPSR